MFHLSFRLRNVSRTRNLFHFCNIFSMNVFLGLLALLSYLLGEIVFFLELEAKKDCYFCYSLYFFCGYWFLGGLPI